MLRLGAHRPAVQGGGKTAAPSKRTAPVITPKKKSAAPAANSQPPASDQAQAALQRLLEAKDILKNVTRMDAESMNRLWDINRAIQRDIEDWEIKHIGRSVHFYR